MATATATNRRIDELAAFAASKAAEFKGPDGLAPTVERLASPSGKGFRVCYDDEPTGLLVEIRYRAGRTTMKATIRNKSLKSYEGARIADLMRTASDLAAHIDLRGRN